MLREAATAIRRFVGGTEIQIQVDVQRACLRSIDGIPFQCFISTDGATGKECNESLPRLSQQLLFAQLMHQLLLGRECRSDEEWIRSRLNNNLSYEALILLDSLYCCPTLVVDTDLCPAALYELRVRPSVSKRGVGASVAFRALVAFSFVMLGIFLAVQFAHREDEGQGASITIQELYEANQQVRAEKHAVMQQSQERSTRIWRLQQHAVELDHANQELRVEKQEQDTLISHLRQHVVDLGDANQKMHSEQQDASHRIQEQDTLISHLRQHLQRLEDKVKERDLEIEALSLVRELGSNLSRATTTAKDKIIDLLHSVSAGFRGSTLGSKWKALVNDLREHVGSTSEPLCESQIAQVQVEKETLRSDFDACQRELRHVRMHSQDEAEEEFPGYFRI